MTRGQRNNLILVAILAALMLATWLSREPPPAPAAELTSVDPEAVRTLRLRYEAATPVRLEKRAGRWWLTEPVELPAERFEVQSILSVARAPSRRSYSRAEVDPAELGLEPPAWQLWLDEVELRFGNTDPIENRRYVAVADRVHQIDDVSASSFDDNYADLASRGLLDGHDDIRRITVPGLEIRKTETGWQAQPPQADADALTAMAAAWRDARASWLVRPTADERDRDRQHARVETERGVLDFLILKHEPQLELVNLALDLKYVLPADAADELLRLPDADADAGGD